MTSKQPKWKRLGFQSDAEYRSACSAKRKTEKASLLASRAERTTHTILRILWQNADFHAPKVTTTKEQIMAEARCSLDSVKRAVLFLRNEGSIKPIKGFKGGRGVPTTYLLKVAGHEKTPLDERIAAMEAKRDREATWRFLRGKYGPVKALEIMGDPEEEADE